MTNWWFIAVALLVAAGLVGMARVVRRETVFEYQHALRFVRGRCHDVLPAGVHWIFTPVTKVHILDSRPRVLTVPGQEVLSQDSVSLKVSLVLEYRVADPKVAVLEAENFEQMLYAACQVALREAVGTQLMEDFLASRSGISAELERSIRPTAEALGLELRSVSIKDIMFPGPLKDAFSQTARAKQEAQASLERARGESAALRNLANAARLLQENPALAQLRLLQTAADADKLVVNYSAAEGAGNLARDAEGDG